MICENKYLIFDPPEKSYIRYMARCCINCFHRVYYQMMYRLVKPVKIGKCKYEVSICAIFKDEAPYLKEWIEFHLIVGIEHFYLYNNNSTDNYMDILRPYIDNGVVTLKDWNIPQGQMQAYKDFADTYSGETRWVGFIDIDEYVVPNKADSVYDFLKQFNNRPSVLIYWKIFGTSGRKTRDINGLVTEDFVVAWSKYVNVGKFFLNTAYEYDPVFKLDGKMHSTWAKCKGIHLPPVNVFNKVCTYGCNPVSGRDMPIQINHYLLKSYDEYMDRKAKRGGGVHPVGMHDMWYFCFHEDKCNTPDYKIFRFLMKLKLALNKE